jgi:hypothetical protein
LLFSTGGIMKKKKIKVLVFRPWNILVIIGFLGIILFITKHGITIPEMPRHYSYIGGIIIALCGIAYFLGKVMHYMKTYGWKTTRAMITASRVDEVDDSEGVLYEPRISYKYNIGTTEYSSSQINPSGWTRSSFPFIASKPVIKYPEGKYVQIYYNPSQPDESFLERKGLLPLLAGLLTFAMTLAAFALALAGIITI